MVIKTRGLRTELIGLLSIAGECHDDGGTAVRQGANLLGDFISGYAGQANVEKDNFGVKLLHRCERRLPVVNDPRGMTEFFEEHGQRFGYVRVVINYEHAKTWDVAKFADLTRRFDDRFGRRIGICHFKHRQPYYKLATAVRSRTEGNDGSAVHFDQATDERQS